MSSGDQRVRAALDMRHRLLVAESPVAAGPAAHEVRAEALAMLGGRLRDLGVQMAGPAGPVSVSFEVRRMVGARRAALVSVRQMRDLGGDHDVEVLLRRPALRGALDDLRDLTDPQLGLPAELWLDLLAPVTGGHMAWLVTVSADGIQVAALQW